MPPLTCAVVMSRTEKALRLQSRHANRAVGEARSTTRPRVSTGITGIMEDAASRDRSPVVHQPERACVARLGRLRWTTRQPIERDNAALGVLADNIERERLPVDTGSSQDLDPRRQG